MRMHLLLTAVPPTRWWSSSSASPSTERIGWRPPRW